MFTSEYYYDGLVCGLDDNVFKFTYTLSLWHPRGRKMKGGGGCHIGITALYEYYLPPNVVIKRKLKIPHCQNSYTIWSMSEQLQYLINISQYHTVRTVILSDQCQNSYNIWSIYRRSVTISTKVCRLVCLCGEVYFYIDHR